MDDEDLMGDDEDLNGRTANSRWCDDDEVGHGGAVEEKTGKKEVGQSRGDKIQGALFLGGAFQTL